VVARGVNSLEYSCVDDCKPQGGEGTMSTLIMGVFAGMYMGNPRFRASMDATIKKAVGYSIDTLNGKGVVIIPPQETDEEK